LAVAIAFDSSSGNHLDGVIAELAVFQKALTVAEASAIERYLGAKWGVTLYSPPTYAAADVNAYITAVETADGGVALEAGVRDAINTFITGCKSDGIWSAIKASCILMGARTLSGALTPLVGSAPTNNNFVSGDYNRKTGLVGDGTSKSLAANRLANDDPTDNCHLAAYVSTVGTGAIMGSNGNPANHTLSNAAHRNRTTTAALFTASSGLVGSSRAASAGYSVRNAGSTSTITQASSAAGANSLVLACAAITESPITRLASR